jgi:hypothetical protein
MPLLPISVATPLAIMLSFTVATTPTLLYRAFGVALGFVVCVSIRAIIVVAAGAMTMATMPLAIISISLFCFHS